MTSSPTGEALITNGSGAVHQAERFAQRKFDPRQPQPRGLSELTKRNRANQSLVTAKEVPLILLVDEALKLHASHLKFLRSMPATVETLASCFDMYLHGGRGYALVILALHCESRETAEAAHFVRRRWSAARILLLERESAMIDDWLYDERVDPDLHSAKLCEAAIRLMAEEKYGMSA